MMPNTITISGTMYKMFIPREDLEDATEPMMPLEQAVGFKVAEETYDLLPLKHQLVLDLIIAGWNQSQIARCLGVSQSTISLTHKRIRYTLANSKLRLMLESRINRHD